MLDCVKVTFDNGDVIFSDFNAEVGREAIARYYMGKTFNLGSVKDDMHKVVKVEFDFEKKKRKWLRPAKSATTDATIASLPVTVQHLLK